MAGRGGGGGFEGDAVCLGLDLKATVTQRTEALQAADVLCHGNRDAAPAGVLKTICDLSPPSSGPFPSVVTYTFF